MDIRQLRYFRSIAELGSFTLAAGRLNVAQSALSRHVQLLEEEFGVALFERRKRRIVLTNSGRLLLGHAKTILQQMERADAEMREQVELPAGEVVIGATAVTSRLLYGRLSQWVGVSLPQVSLKLLQGNPYILLEALDTGRVDLAIMVNPEPVKTLVIEMLTDEVVYLVSKKGDRKAPRKISGIADLRGLPLVVLSRPNGSRIHLDRAAAEAGIALTIQHEVASFEVVNDFVLHGLGYGLVPHSSIMLDIHARDLAAIPIPDIALTRNLVRHAERSVTPAAHEVIHHIHSVFRELRDQGSFGPAKLAEDRFAAGRR